MTIWNNPFKVAPFLLATLVMVSCSCQKTETETAQVPVNETDSLLPPVETQAPNTSYSPAFEGQTRAPGIKTKSTYTVTEIASGLASPWGMCNLPDGRIVITEKKGTLRIVTQAGSIGAAITGLPAVNSNGQGGLLDIAADPDFANNRMLYWCFSQTGNGGTATAVAKGRLSNDETKIENPQVIYTAIPEFNGTLHYGSRLEWDGQGNLFVSTGERSSIQSRPEAQKLDAALGKVLRITKDGQAAAGNPFIGQQNVLPEIYSYGHRNVQSLARHPQTGDLWEAEMGPKGGDEVNLIAAGKDYGWPSISYGLEYSGGPIGAGITQKAGMEQPIYYWDPSVSPSGMTFYTGGLISEWRNNLFIGCLSGQHIVRLVIENNKIKAEERLLEDLNERFRDVLEGTDGAIYAITDSGLLYRIGL